MSQLLKSCSSTGLPHLTQLLKPNTQKSNILTSYPVHQLILLNLHLKYILNLPNCNFVQASAISCRLSSNILYQFLLLSPTVYSLHITSMLNTLQCRLIILCLHFNLPVWQLIPLNSSPVLSHSTSATQAYSIFWDMPKPFPPQDLDASQTNIFLSLHSNISLNVTFSEVTSPQGQNRNYPPSQVTL